MLADNQNYLARTLAKSLTRDDRSFGTIQEIGPTREAMISFRVSDLETAIREALIAEQTRIEREARSRIFLTTGINPATLAGA